MRPPGVAKLVVMAEMEELEARKVERAMAVMVAADLEVGWGAVEMVDVRAHRRSR